MANLQLEGLGPVIEVEKLGQKSLQNSEAFQRRLQEEVKKSGIEVSDTKSSGASEKTFANMLENSIEKVNELQVHADKAIKELVAGRTKNVHETMLAVERADLSLKLMMQVRNKIIDAYREIMRMQV